MITRLLAKCPACSDRIVLRITVAGGRQPFLFACPYCRTELRATLVAHLNKAFDFESDDLSLLPNDDEEPEDLALAVNTDLPVHASLVGQRAADAYQSPFLHLTTLVDSEEVEELTDHVHRMRDLREQAYPHLRRAAAAFARGDLANVQFILKQAPGGERIDFARTDPVNLLGVGIALLYEPFEDAAARKSAAEEWAQVLGEARTRDAPGLRNIMDEFADVLKQHRTRVIDSCFAALADPSSLIPAVWLEAIEPRTSLDDYVVMRDDFDTLKGRYQDLFEAASRGLVFTARVANLARRGDADQHIDGTTRTLHKALNKTTAFQREAWLSDFPEAKVLHDRMKRHTRNDIGHRLVHYDFASGDLVYDDGGREKYVHFLVDYLHAVRLSHHVLDICEVLWYADEATL